MGNTNTFDSTICFTMMGNWLDTAFLLEKYYGAEVSMKLIHMINDYCRYGIVPTEETMGADAITLLPLWTAIQESAKHSVERRKSHFKGDGLTEKQQAIIEAYKKAPDKKVNQLATELGISWAYVDKVIKAYSTEAPKQEKAIPTATKPISAPVTRPVEPECYCAAITSVPYQELKNEEIEEDDELPF